MVLGRNRAALMKMKKLKNSYGFLIIGLLGFVLFFPWKYVNGQTCIVDRWLKYDIHDGKAISFETRLHRYVWPYGILWWLSGNTMVIGLKHGKYHKLKWKKIL